MGLPVNARVCGVATLRPMLGGFTPPTSGDVLPLDVDQTYTNYDAKSRTVTENVGSPYVLPLDVIPVVRFFVIEVKGGVLTLLITTPASGSPQSVTVSDKFLMSCPAVGSEITGIEMYAPALTSIEVRWQLAGNPS